MSAAPAPDRTLFLTREQAIDVLTEFKTPCYVYDRIGLENAARAALAFPSAYGCTVRYAMKANPSRGVLETFRNLGLHIDASSDFEVERALRAGFSPEKIQLTSQMPSTRLNDWVTRGVLFNACSLLQLKMYGLEAPGKPVTVRINAGLGSGSTNRTNVGGPSSSFGIWKDYIPKVKELAETYRLPITGLHTHIGSGAETKQWEKAVELTLKVAAEFPDVVRVSLGGGLKIRRMPPGSRIGFRKADFYNADYTAELNEDTPDLQGLGRYVSEQFIKFAKATKGRKLHLEIEPGTLLVARAGAVVASCIDFVDTGDKGYRFAKLDAGMTEILRPSLYGAQHPIDVFPMDGTERAMVDTVFVGPCCESGDILTPLPGDSEGIAMRLVPQLKRGDLVVIGGAGAYCAAMATINYNSYPQAPEVMLERDGTLRPLRERQEPSMVWAGEDEAERKRTNVPGPTLPSDVPAKLPIMRPSTHRNEAGGRSRRREPKRPTRGKQ